jgi:hypothetical protein
MDPRQKGLRGISISVTLLVTACALIILGGDLQAIRAAASPAEQLCASQSYVPFSALTGCGEASWQVVPSPNYTSTSNVLRSVAVSAPNDAWAVGSHNSSTYIKPLIEHWDGAIWSLTPNNVSDGVLYGVAAISSDDAWAVGNQGGSSLAMHWDGDGWTVVSTPNVSTTVEILFDVAAVSSNDVWAVGRIGNDMPGATLLLHWDGTSWASVQTASPTATTVPQNFPTTLYGVDALPSGDVWAVGIREAITHTSVSLVMHYAGGQWTQSPVPVDIGDLSGVEVISPDDVWAVGTDWDSSSGGIVGRTIHWDGQTWSVVPNPPGILGCNLFGVAAESSDRVWAVGHCLTGTDPAQSLTLVMLWDGTQWSIVASPNINGAQYNRLNSVAVAQPGDIMAVGQHGSVGSYSTLVERYYDPSCAPTSTPVPPSPTTTTVPPTSTHAPPPATAVTTSTDVPASPTSTPVVPADTAVPTATAGIPTDTPAPPASTSTSIPTATETSCAITFTDVPDDNVFYPFVRCLACRGILGGYDDGTFRPNNNVTRGQIAKIVSSAAGIEDDPGAQMYEDVDLTNTFYVWINRLSNRGYMSGYECGGPDEPCDTDNMPYFRPFGNATRGQIAKIVSNAAGIEDDPGAQMYEDVPPDNPFFLWIQRVGHLNIMNGYACGGPGEPCSCYGPCAYFRAYSNTTRGQTAKTASKAFFPECTSR